MSNKEKLEELLIANRELSIQIAEKERQATELDIANEEKAKQIAELVIANVEKQNVQQS